MIFLMISHLDDLVLPHASASYCNFLVLTWFFLNKCDTNVYSLLTGGNFIQIIPLNITLSSSVFPQDIIILLFTKQWFWTLCVHYLDQLIQIKMKNYYGDTLGLSLIMSVGKLELTLLINNNLQTTKRLHKSEESSQPDN